MADRRGVLALVVGVILVLGACGRVVGGAAGRFRPSTPGVLKVATAEVPLAGFWEGSMPDPDGGFEQGLAAALAERFDLSRIEVLTVPFGDLIAGRLGGADIAVSQLTPTSERGKVLDFSIPYLASTPAVLTSQGNTVNDLASAREQRFSVQRRSTLAYFLDTVVVPGEPVRLVDDLHESVEALGQGTVDAVLVDLPVASAIASRSNGRLVVTGQFDSDDSLAVAMPQDSPNREAVDSALRAFTDDGIIRDLARRWLAVSLTGVQAERVPLIPAKL